MFVVRWPPVEGPVFSNRYGISGMPSNGQVSEETLNLSPEVDFFEQAQGGIWSVSHISLCMAGGPNASLDELSDL